MRETIVNQFRRNKFRVSLAVEYGILYINIYHANSSVIAQQTPFDMVMFSSNRKNRYAIVF